MSRAITEIDVALDTRSYPIRIGSGLLNDAAHWCDAIRGKDVLIASDGNVAPLYAERVRQAMEGCGVDAAVSVLPAGEAHKNPEAVSKIFEALAQLGAARDACVIALGGGVVGDTAGFAAACWMRGVDFIQMPTTLLAMVDSSVGGKTGVDLPQGKNLVGAFHQPRAVIADLDTLATLPERELRAGFAEVVKAACIGDAEFFSWLEANSEALLARDADALTHAIATCCRFKAGVVMRDERESGERALLNFGHTFGHAIETETGYGTLLHGEAVAIGMVMAARLSERIGMAAGADTQRLRAVLEKFGLPTRLPEHLQAEALAARMRLDKKTRGGAVRLILWRGIGHAEVVERADDSSVLSVVSGQPT